jgi:hypothetical protein
VNARPHRADQPESPSSSVARCPPRTALRTGHGPAGHRSNEASTVPDRPVGRATRRLPPGVHPSHKRVGNHRPQ